LALFEEFIILYVAKIVLESIQELLLKLALQMTRDDYETRRERQRQGVQLAKVAGKYAGRLPDATTRQSKNRS
jgi:DNA invertase Pin-like site-specific DNA recombinase